MDPTTKNIIEEINSYISNGDVRSNIESRGINLIESSINLITVINENFDPQLAEELTKRFINSIKNKDSEKFKRKIRDVKKHKKDDSILTPSIIDGGDI